MAQHTNITAQDAENFDLLEVVVRPFIAIFGFFVRIAETHDRMDQIEHLQAMSDEKLSEMGLRREDIVRHVYRDHFYVGV